MSLTVSDLQTRINACWGQEPDAEAVESTIALLDRGEIRVAHKDDGEWISVLPEWKPIASVLMNSMTRFH